MLKRIFSLILVLTMLAGYMPPLHVHAEEMENAEPYVAEATAVAEETTAETELPAETTGVDAEVAAEPTQPETVPEETTAPTEKPEEVLQFEEFVYTSEADFTSEELYEAYAANLFFGNSFSFFRTAAGEMLTGDEKLLYDALTTFIKQVACGQRAAATISIGQELSGYPVDIEVTFTGTGFTSMQLGRVLDALMADLPFEFYWYEKTSGCTANKISTGSSLLQIILGFNVADNYNTGDPFTADTAKTGAAAQSVARAKDIVDAYASKSDYEKLVGYKEEICDLVNYNWDAAWGNVFSTDIDPWQLIYVFDGDPATKVVCEGYSKAFQYLCDLTDFKGDVTCYMVTGLMDGGGHMWNIVSINDVNYFADVTNSDSDSIGYDGRLFLAGASGSVATGYTIGGIQYVYDEDTKILWGAGEDSILNLSPVKYTPPAPGEEEDEQVASGTCGENLTWELDDAGTLTISGTGKMDDYYAHTDPPVAPWDAYKDQIVSVVIGEGVTATGAYAFGKSYNLTSVTLPSSLTVLGQGTFWECQKLEEITLPSNLHTIEHEVFLGCSALKTIEIPASVTYISDCAFGDNRKLDGIWVNKSNAYYCNDDYGVLFNKTKTNLIAVPASMRGEYMIPSGVERIQRGAFVGCSSLSGVIIPDTVTSIGDFAFYYCSNLTSINIPDSVTSIGYGAFCTCGLTSIDIPDSVTSIGFDAFRNCGNLKSVRLPSGLSRIENCTFCYCSSLESIRIPDGVTSIGNGAFGICPKLESVYIPDSVTSIEEDAFTGCTSLTDVYYGGNEAQWQAITIGSNNEPLTGATLHCAIGGTCGENLTWELDDEGTLTISGTGEMTDYWDAEDRRAPWYDFGKSVTSVVIEDGVTGIGSYAFYDCTSLANVAIGNGVTDIGMWAFSFCSSLTSITLPDGVTGIGGYAFSNCESLTSITIPESVTNIEDCAFQSCSSLTDITIPEGITWLGKSLFSNCDSLTSITIPTSVEFICYSAFASCDSLTDIVIPANTAIVENWAFAECTSLNEITFLGDAPEIGEEVFLEVTATAYYPAGNPTWTADKLQNYGGTITWISSCTNHNVVTDPAVSATCTATGLSEGSHCTICNEVFVAQEVIPALGHDMKPWETIIEPTCTEDGEKLRSCRRCDHIESVDILATGHTEVIDEAVAATCTATGLTEGKRCAACNEVLVAQTVIDALGHSEVVDEAVAPTCAETGLTEGKHCSVCNEVLVAQTVVDALGHTEVIDAAVAPTCTETGLTEGKHCSVCNEVLVAQEVVDALGHAEVIDEAVAATCTETGLTEGKHCDRCGEIYVAQEVIPALGHEFAVQNGEIVCAVCGETVTIHIHQDYVALDIYENPQVQLYVDIAPANLTADLSWSAEGNDGILQFDQNGLITALRAGTAYVAAELTVDGYTISSRCRVDVTENVQILGIQLSTDKVTTELYKDEFATFEILLDLPQNHPFTGDELVVTDDVAMSASGLENKSNLIESVQFKTISDLFELVLLDDRTVQIVPTQKAMESGKTLKSSYTDTVIVKIKGEEESRKKELKMTLTVKKTMPKPKAKINAFNSFYERQSQEIVITGVDVTGIRANESKNTGKTVAIPNWLTLEDGKLTLNGNTPKSSDKAYLLVDVEGWRYPAELTLSVKHARKVPGIKLAATTVTVADRNASTEVELKLLCTNKNDTLKDLNITGITVPKDYSIENINVDDGTFTLKKEGGFTSDRITLTVAYGSATKDLTLNVKTQLVKLKLSSAKVSLNKELPDQAVVEVSCTTKNYKFDLNDAVLTYDDKMLDIERAGNALIIRLKDGAEYGKTYPVSVSADYQGAPVAKLNVAVLKKGSEVKSTIKATGTLDVIREGTAITIKPTYTNYLNVNVDTDAVLKIYSSKDSFKKAIAEVYAENGIFTIDSSVISNHVLKYKAQLETVIGGETIKSNQISLSVKMGAAKLTAESSGTTMFAKDRNDRAVVWFESSDATLNDVASIQIKDAKYKDAFEIIDYRDGSFAIAFKDGKIHESIAKQLEKKSSVSITLNLNVFIEGNETVDPAISKTAKANATQKVKLTIVK